MTYFTFARRLIIRSFWEDNEHSLLGLTNRNVTFHHISSHSSKVNAGNGSACPSLADHIADLHLKLLKSWGNQPFTMTGFGGSTTFMGYMKYGFI